MKNYEEKRDRLLFKQYHECPVCGKPIPLNQCTLHHKFEDGKNGNFRQRNYPLFIHSLKNLQVVHLHCHIGEQKTPTGKLIHYSYLEADKYEKFFRRHPLFAKQMNCDI